MQQIYTPKLTKVNKVFIAMMVAFFLLDSIFAKFMNVPLGQYFALSAMTLKAGLVFQIVTYPLVGRGLLEVVFNGLLFWFVGSEIETLWGRQKYISFLLFCTMLPGVLFVLLSSLFAGGSLYLTGVGGLASSLLLIYSLYFPDRQFSFMLMIPVKARIFCWIIIGMELYWALFTPMASQAWGHLSAMLMAFLFYRFSGRFSFSSILPRPKARVKKRNLTLVKGDEEERPPKYWQ